MDEDDNNILESLQNTISKRHNEKDVFIVFKTVLKTVKKYAFFNTCSLKF